MTSMIDALRKPSVTNQSPTREDIQRNDLLLVAWLIFVLFLGVGIRNRAINASKTLVLGENLPTIAAPANWITGQSEDLIFYAKNPQSASSFDAQVSVFVRDLKENETLAMARIGWGVKRSQTLSNYRELAAEQVKVLNGDPGIQTIYAYIADPTRAAGAVGPPVVVRGQDLIFTYNGKLLVVTMAADSAEWESELSRFRIVTKSLKVQGGEE